MPSVRVRNYIQLHLDRLRPKAQTSDLPEKLVKDKHSSLFYSSVSDNGKSFTKVLHSGKLGPFFKLKNHSSTDEL